MKDKTLLEITPTYEKEYTIPEWLFNPICNSYTRFRAMYPKESFTQFYKLMDKAFKAEIKVRKTKVGKMRTNGLNPKIIYLNESINL